MASTYLTRTQTTGNRKTWTWSAWVKFSKIAIGEHDQKLFLAHNNTHPSTQIITNSMRLGIYTYDGASTNFNVTCNRYLRDSSGWFHLVIAVDTTQSTASDRVKIYINGVQETSFLTASYPSQNFDTQVNLNNVISQVSGGGTPSNAFDGSMSHVHFIDGTAYDASAFGETDATTGEWVGKTSPSVTYGTNGFFILKDGNGITDQSGEGNDFTLGGGTLTNLKDNPENVFATLNAIDTFSETDYSNGNTKSTRSTGGYRSAFSTLGFTTGKYYAEFKVYDVANGNGLGVLNLDKSPYGTYISGTEKYIGINDNAVGLFSNILYYNNVNQGGTWTAWSNGDIIGLAVDATNGYAYWSVNGTWQNSGNPTAGTGGYALSNIGSNGTYVMGCSNSTSSTEVNFGNGYFGTTAVSSAGTNASDNGIFEYDVPTGYTALSTKGLNE